MFMYASVECNVYNYMYICTLKRYSHVRMTSSAHVIGSRLLQVVAASHNPHPSVSSSGNGALLVL